jgi:sterol carrier protein 2
VAAIASKAHAHCVNNPYSQFQNKMTIEEVKADKQASNHLTRAMCCPTSDGAGCAIIASADFVHKHGLESQA